jgi:butyryl-CoA dehydrogenase
MTTSTETGGRGPQARSDGGFDLSLSEEQLLVQKTARDFAREKVLPKAAEIDENNKIPTELIKEMGTLGFMGIDVPEEYGGSGLDRLTYMLVVEEINRACASTGVVLCTHVSLAIEPLLRFGTDAQKKRWLPAMATGEKLGCFALSEPA